MRMKKILSLAIAAVVATSFAACDLETSDNGNLDGLWHLERVDTLATGGVCDCSKGYRFWGVQHKLIFIYGTEGDSYAGSYYLRFEQTADELNITKMYANHWHEDNPDTEQGGDVPVLEIDDNIRHLGINELPENFTKEKLTGSQMILRTEKLRLTFRKF